MTSPSPSEFLTFYRRLTASQCLRYRSIPPMSRRPFTISAVYQANTSNPNAVSNRGTQQDTGPGQGTGASREHALDKADKDDPNVQSAESNFGREYVHHQPTPFLSLRTGDEVFERGEDGWENEVTYADAIRSARAQDSGGHATKEADERDSTKRTKQDHPEAPDVVIGMQDERGGKGA